jgi:SAM-dependent methyltransferase
VAEAQRQTIPELTRVFGSTGLYLRPFLEYSSELSGNMLGSVLSIGRSADALAGQWECHDGALPIGNGSLSLVYVLFVLETSPDPVALIQEVARVLKSDGVALLVCLNPMSPSRLRWLGRPTGIGLAQIEAQAREAGLESVRRQALGPVWLGGTAASGGDPASGPRLLDPFRAAQMLVMRRYEIPVTPIRAGAPVVGFRPGVSAG